MRKLVALAFAAAVLAAPGHAAWAYDAVVSWTPVAGAAGYRLYAYTDEDHLTGHATDVGAAQPDVDGLIRYVVKGLPVASASFFAVTAYGEGGAESEMSNALVLTERTLIAVLERGGDATVAAAPEEGEPAMPLGVLER